MDLSDSFVKIAIFVLTMLASFLVTYAKLNQRIAILEREIRHLWRRIDANSHPRIWRADEADRD